MKKILILAALTVSVISYAQPVISNGNNIPYVGYSDTFSIVSSGVNPGMSGANVTWDFSKLTPTLAGTAQFVSPSSTPYASAFPTANVSIELNPFMSSSIYEYYIVSASKWEVVGSAISGSGGDSYTANPKTVLPFPFSYQDMVRDTFTKSNGTFTTDITYDGYGTLITPYTTYNNVVRVKREFGGSDYFYDWFATSPYLLIVASYDNNTGNITFLGKSNPTGVNDIASTNAKVTITPNPVTSTSTISVRSDNELKNGKVLITDITGKCINELQLHNNEAIFSRASLTAGMYFYTVYSNSAAIAKGKFVID